MMSVSVLGASAVPVGLVEVERYLAQHKPELLRRCYAFARRAFESIRDAREQAALLQLLQNCPLPGQATLVQVDEAYARGGNLGPKGLSTLDPNLGHVWRGYGNKLGHSGVPPERHEALRRWFYAALVLGNDTLLAASTVH